MFKLALVVLTIMLVYPHCWCQSSQQQFVSAHSSARATVGVHPLIWSTTLANYAQRYADSHQRDCRMVHSGGPYGENIAWSSGDMSIAAAVKIWVDEKAWYHYRTNTCEAGKICRHYAQVVSGKSLRLGCAKVRCNNGGTLITCNYDPPGNFYDQWLRLLGWVWKGGIA